MSQVLRRPAAVLLVLAAVLFGSVAAAPAMPTDVVDTADLVAGITAARLRDHLVALDAIARAHGGNRAVGTSGYQASADYVRDRLNASGYQVTMQPFKVDHFEEKAPPVLRGPRPFRPESDFRTMTYSGSGDVTAAVQPVDLVLPPTDNPTSTSGCEPADFAGFSRGAVALVQRGSCTFVQKVANAKAAGASAVLIMNEGQPERQDVLSGSLEHPGTDIPVLGLSYAAGAELARVPDTPVRVTTDVVSGLLDSVNVIADGVGGRSDRVVMVGAHLDSVPEGPGVNDDGSGVALVLELADRLARQAIIPRNRIRFAFWGAEEAGTVGSDHYVLTLPDDQREEIGEYLNFDMVASPNYVRYVYDGDGSAVGNPGPPGSAAIEKMFGEYLTAQGLTYEPTEFNGRSDYAAFALAGIPVGGVFSGADERKTQVEATRYGGTSGKLLDSCYHQPCDTIANINDEVLEQLAKAAADVTLRLLMSSADLRQSG